MRVIAGIAKGHRLKTPRGARLRPTTDLVRGAIFSMLAPLLPEAPRILDLYAGTGALGIEALSRGASWADFVEEKAACCQILRANLEQTKLQGQAHVYQRSVQAALADLEGPYDLVLCDPPYDDPQALGVLERLGQSALVRPGSILVLEHRARQSPPPRLGRLALRQQRRYGDSAIAVYREEGAHD